MVHDLKAEEGATDAELAHRELGKPSAEKNEKENDSNVDHLVSSYKIRLLSVVFFF